MKTRHLGNILYINIFSHKNQPGEQKAHQSQRHIYPGAAVEIILAGEGQELRHFITVELPLWCSNADISIIGSQLQVPVSAHQ